MILHPWYLEGDVLPLTIRAGRAGPVIIDLSMEGLSVWQIESPA